jgi:hypothetical protein
LIAEYARNGAFDEPAATSAGAAALVIPLSGSRDVALGDDLASAVGAVLGQVRPGDYVAFTAYIERNAEHELQLDDVRQHVRDALKVATTVGFGPRFLHSTGQLHKGGPDRGVFFQLTHDTPAAEDLPIPGMVSFATLLRAQALGDFESLDKRGRRGLRIHLTGPLETALDVLAAALEDAVGAKA